VTRAIQIADLIAYIISWGLRLKGMSKPIGPEIKKGNASFPTKPPMQRYEEYLKMQAFSIEKNRLGT